MSDSTAPELLGVLRNQGAHLFDPVAFHYLEALSIRASAHHGSARQRVDSRLLDAIAHYRDRLERAQSEAASGSVAQRALPAARETLADLVRHMAQIELHGPHDAAGDFTGQRVELKSVRNFRDTWSRLRINKQVRQALQQAPKNAGPLNSQVVALRSLALMRDIAPDYLNRFMSHVDTLLCLEQGDGMALPAAQKNAAATGGGTKVKAARSRTR